MAVRRREIDRLYQPSVEVFVKEYLQRGVPVILEGCMNEWPAFHKWTVPYFMDELGHKVCVHVCCVWCICAMYVGVYVLRVWR